jgi:DNA (cytosine-5)-methyltransferase 1
LNEYGVPQKRTRVIFVGLRKKVFGTKSTEILQDFYRDFRQKHSVKKEATASDALQGLPKFKPTSNSENRKISHLPEVTKVLNHRPRFHSARDIETFRLLADDIQSGANKYVTVEALKKLYTLKTGKESAVHKYYVIRPNEPSNTIPAHLYKDGLRHIHWDPTQARSISVREAARLQSFDDDFEFLGTMGDQYKMIGNAVPPRFAYLLATSLVELLRKR